MMKKYSIISLTFLLTILSDSYCLSQGGQDYSGYGYFEIGWSADGKRFAWCEFNRKVTTGEMSDIYIKEIRIGVIDIVADKDLYQSQNSWNEEADDCPGSVNDALRAMGAEVENNLTQNGIQLTGERNTRPLTMLPFEMDGNSITVEIREKPAESGSNYEFYAISNNLGEKKIFSFEGNQNNLESISIMGYSLNPQLTRMALLIYSFEGGYDGQAIYRVFVTGCHLTSGFTKIDK